MLLVTIVLVLVLIPYYHRVPIYFDAASNIPIRSDYRVLSGQVDEGERTSRLMGSLCFFECWNLEEEEVLLYLVIKFYMTRQIIFCT
jgi:hypothetical protein